MAYLFDIGRSARAFHECKSNQQEALQILRVRKLTKASFERDRPGARLAPAIDVLRNGWGFDIAGEGSVDDPYWMLSPTQSPAKVQTTSAIKANYYASEHWKETRERRYRFDNYRCVLCVDSCREQLQCHHITYNLFNEQLDELLTVCARHHELIHDSKVGCRLAFPIGVETWIAERLLGHITYPFEDWLLP